jgi:DNA-binding transcriptional ArsR family regulator
MSTIFPLREKVSLDDGREPRLVDLDDDVADEVFEALSSATTRQIFSALHDSPQTASDLADVTDTSVQNTQYHLGKLADADLVEVVDTWYSERGTEMKVYAPTDESLVLFAGNDKGSSLRALLKRVVGVVAMLLPASAAVAWLARQYSGQPTAPAGGGQDAAPAPGTATETAAGGGDGGAGILTDGGEAVNGTATPGPAPSPTPTHTPTETPQAAVDVAGGLDPALLAGSAFFLGGVLVLGVLVLWSR